MKETARRKSVVWIYLLVAVVAVGFVVWHSRGYGAPTVKLGRTVSVKTGDISVRVSENGTLEPVTQVDVKSRVAGRVQRIYVREGDRVRTGQLLAIVDPTEVARQVAGLQAQVASARAALHQAKENYDLTRAQNALAIARSEAALDEAKKRLTQAAAPTRRQDVEQQESAVIRADATVEDARRTLARKQSLVAKGFIAQADADSAQTALAVAEADAASARQHLSLLKEGARTEDIDVAKAAVRSAQVQLETDRANAGDALLRYRDVERAQADVAQNENQLAQQAVQLNETRIVSPDDGEVVGKYVEEGELVASATAGFAQGATIVRIADLSKMQVRVNINEVDVAHLRIGMPVDIHIDGLPEKTFAGTVAAIAPASIAENQSTASGQSSSSGQTGVVRFEVKIAVTSRDSRLRPGMTAAVDIIQDRHRNVLVLPTEALQSGNKVTVVTGDDKTPVKTVRTVDVGLKNDANVEIRSGLKSGDRVEVPTVSAPDRRKIDMGGPD